MSNVRGRRFLLFLSFILLLCSGLIVQVEVSYSVEEYAEEVCVDPAQIGWVQTNDPPGGKILRLIQNPQQHNELFVLSDTGDVYKSSDKGDTWAVLDALKNITVSTLAVYNDMLFIGGNGRLFRYDRDGNLTLLLADTWHEVFVSDGKLFVVRQDVRKSVGILCADLTSGSYEWRDISPSESELTDLVLPPEDTRFWYGMLIKHLVSLDECILANIVMELEGSGDYTNGLLYRSEDGGGSWSKANLTVREGLIVSNIVS